MKSSSIMLATLFFFLWDVYALLAASVYEHVFPSSLIPAQNVPQPLSQTQAADILPVVLMHGMGDAAENPGMQSIRKDISTALGGVHTVCIPIGNTRGEDTKNGFFMDFDEQTEIFAANVRKDKTLKDGFNAMGFSQGNLIIRAYIERFNDPPVKNFISVHGPMAGVGTIPKCDPSSSICKEIHALIARAAYSEWVQGHIAQANYYRDPNRIPEYVKNAKFLPDINNEKGSINETYKANFNTLRKLVLVKAEKDTMVYPKESEWFGAYKDGSLNEVVKFNETVWYKQDSFGFKSLFEKKAIEFLTTSGDHLQIKKHEILGWVQKYFLASKSS